MSGPARRARAEVPGPVICDYVVREPQRPRELILLLHGFGQAGQVAFDKFGECCPEDAVVLAPSAPYPWPERRAEGDGYRVGYSWYFYDPKRDTYFIDMKVSVQVLGGLVRQLGYGDLPKRLIGFSQGGYLAPFAALELTGVRQVIGVAAEFLAEELNEAARARGSQWPPSFRADGVHGEQDEIVSLQSAIRGHEAILGQGAQGTLMRVAGATHRAGPEIQSAVQALVQDFLG